MRKMVRSWGFILLTLFLCLFAQVITTSLALAAGATTSLHVVKYDTDGKTVLTEKTVDYEWMEKNIQVYGDGKTHYYHQGPVFEGDMWDGDEVNNLKDKGAVKGTAVKDLCNLVGGMDAKDEVMLVSIDSWHTEFAYDNIYKPAASQGSIALCWYNGEDSVDGESYGIGYPANNAYHSAMQIVFMTEETNKDGKHVFGNTDMKTALPEEKYQHFFEGQYPSTNGLSGKWISEVRIYSGGVPENLNVAADDGSTTTENETETEKSGSWLPIVLVVAGVVLVGIYFLMRRKTNEK